MKVVALLAVLLPLVLLALHAQADTVVNFNFENMLSGVGGNCNDCDGDNGGDDAEELEACPSYVRLVNGYTQGDIDNLPGMEFVTLRCKEEEPIN